MCVNNWAKVVTWKQNRRDSNPRDLFSGKSNDLTTMPPGHSLLGTSITMMALSRCCNIALSLRDWTTPDYMVECSQDGGTVGWAGCPTQHFSIVPHLQDPGIVRCHKLQSYWHGQHGCDNWPSCFSGCRLRVACCTMKTWNSDILRSI